MTNDSKRRKNRSRRAAGGLVISTLLLGCARRAPGPDECHDVAVRLSRSGGVRPMLRRPASPFPAPVDDSLESDVMDRTTECLTMPYDRELVACIQAGGSGNLCFRAFRARRSASG